MELVNRRIIRGEMLFHSAIKAWASSCKFDGWFWRSLTRRPRTYQTYSIGDKSDDLDGQSNTCTLFCYIKVLLTRLVCVGALSCWKMAQTSWRLNKGSNNGLRISSRYRMPVKSPFNTSSLVRVPPQIPPQTITLPPPMRSRSATQQVVKRFPCRLRSLPLPSPCCRQSLVPFSRTFLNLRKFELP